MRTASLHSSVQGVSTLLFQVFRELLKVSRHFGAAELEAVIVASPGDEGLLPDIHMVSRNVDLCTDELQGNQMTGVLLGDEGLLLGY